VVPFSSRVGRCGEGQAVNGVVRVQWAGRSGGRHGQVSRVNCASKRVSCATWVNQRGVGGASVGSPWGNKGEWQCGVLCVGSVWHGVQVSVW